MSTFYALLTAAGAAALTNAYAAGTTVGFTHLAVGDGSGNPVLPTEAFTALVNERHRVPISSLSIDAENPNWLIAEAIIPANIGGWTVREVGLIGAGNKLLVVGNFPDTYKPLLTEGSARDLIVRVYFETGNVDQVTLTIDPAVVVATAQSVANAVFTHEQKPDPHPQYLTQPEGDERYLQSVPNATTATRGIVELATNTECIAGTDTVRAVTPAWMSATIADRLLAERAKNFYLSSL